MTIYKNDKGVYATAPLPAGEVGEEVKWEPVDEAPHVEVVNGLVRELKRAQDNLTFHSELATRRQRRLDQIEEYVKEAAKSGEESINIQEFASEFGFSLEVEQEFSLTITVSGTATFPVGEEPDLSNFDVSVDISDYYGGTEIEVTDSSIDDYNWE